MKLCSRRSLIVGPSDHSLNSWTCRGHGWFASQQQKNIDDMKEMFGGAMDDPKKQMDATDQRRPS